MGKVAGQTKNHYFSKACPVSNIMLFSFTKNSLTSNCLVTSNRYSLSRRKQRTESSFLLESTDDFFF